MKQVIALTLMVLVAAFSRMIPHPWNFTAVGAMALFGGAYFPSKPQSLLIPFAALLISDLVLGFHNTMFFVYGAFLLTVMMGWNLREQKSVVKTGTWALVGSAVFFLITNFGVWVMTGLYPLTAEGLTACYVAAIPFFGNQIAGDVFFTAVLFVGYEALKKFSPELATPVRS